MYMHYIRTYVHTYACSYCVKVKPHAPIQCTTSAVFGRQAEGRSVYTYETCSRCIGSWKLTVNKFMVQWTWKYFLSQWLLSAQTVLIACTNFTYLPTDARTHVPFTVFTYWNSPMPVSASTLSLLCHSWNWPAYVHTYVHMCVSRYICTHLLLIVVLSPYLLWTPSQYSSNMVDRSVQNTICGATQIHLYTSALSALYILNIWWLVRSAIT